VWVQSLTARVWTSAAAAAAVTMKKRSEATQTLRAGCSKADPQTNTQTGPITIHCAAASLARSVMNNSHYALTQQQTHN